MHRDLWACAREYGLDAGQGGLNAAACGSAGALQAPGFVRGEESILRIRLLQAANLSVEERLIHRRPTAAVRHRAVWAILKSQTKQKVVVSAENG
ncbi:hypothetical protein OOZ54_13305 [Rhodopseudomonas palustris]|uniref:hypothetical protein n=1 Tax=Rhodopseudomonas palustris TaxID=1076 RepID=UPI0022F08DD5|nr:hypothetical protein [Rhodopseudomonas palustris]WBU27640.1 hypothetical protein OOZ54_13305 [Rhodopseudomonas palustris]